LTALNAIDTDLKVLDWQVQECSLLAGGPVVCHLAAERTVLMVASLSESGALQAFVDGQAALLRSLNEVCLAGISLPADNTVHWKFVDNISVLQPESLAGSWLADWWDEQSSPREPIMLRTAVSAATADLWFYIPPNLYWFGGHFPNLPILPGIVQIDWVIRYGQLLGFDMQKFAGMPRMKFSALIRPETVLHLQLTSKGRSLTFAYESITGPHSMGAIRFE
jgi:hypothetical protein